MGRPSRYAPAVRERAVRLGFEPADQADSPWAVIRSGADKIGGSSETLRPWGRRAERETGRRPGLTSEARARRKDLECAVLERRRTNEMLRKASAYVAHTGSLYLEVAPLLLVFLMQSAGRGFERVEIDGRGELGAQGVVVQDRLTGVDVGHHRRAATDRPHVSENCQLRAMFGSPGLAIPGRHAEGDPSQELVAVDIGPGPAVLAFRLRDALERVGDVGQVGRPLRPGFRPPAAERAP